MLLKFFVFKWFNGVFSHRLIARCQALLLVLSRFYVEVIPVKQLHNFHSILHCIISKGLPDDNCSTKNSTQCITSIIIIRPPESYRFWLGVAQSVFNTLLLHGTFHLFSCTTIASYTLMSSHLTSHLAMGSVG